MLKPHVTGDTIVALITIGFFVFFFASYSVRKLFYGSYQYVDVGSTLPNQFFQFIYEATRWWGDLITKCIKYIVLNQENTYLLFGKIEILPNHFTWLSLILAFLSGISFAVGGFAIGGLCFILSGYFDKFDGDFARYIHKDSLAGGELDTILDRYSDIFVFGGLFFYYHNFSEWIFLITFFALVGISLVSYASARASIINLKLSYNLMRKGGRVVLIGFGGLAAAISVGFFEVERPGMAYPMIFILMVVAVGSNIVALLNFRRIYTTLSKI